MAIELTPPRELTGLADLQDQLARAAADLGLGAALGAELLAAAAAAWAAVLAAQGGGVMMTLERAGLEVGLTLAFDPAPGAGRPPGLAQALFCPPAIKAGYDEEDGRVSFRLAWEVQ